jgi:hypothetical protein
MICARWFYFVGALRRANTQKIPSNNVIDPLRTPGVPMEKSEGDPEEEKRE